MTTIDRVMIKWQTNKIKKWLQQQVLQLLTGRKCKKYISASFIISNTIENDEYQVRPNVKYKK